MSYHLLFGWSSSNLLRSNAACSPRISSASGPGLSLRVCVYHHGLPSFIQHISETNQIDLKPLSLNPSSLSTLEVRRAPSLPPGLSIHLSDPPTPTNPLSNLPPLIQLNSLLPTNLYHHPHLRMWQTTSLLLRVRVSWMKPKRKNRITRTHLRRQHVRVMILDLPLPIIKTPRPLLLILRHFFTLRDRSRPLPYLTFKDQWWSPMSIGWSTVKSKSKRYA